MKLVVVESPAKAKTIEKYLGPGHRVLASMATGAEIILPSAERFELRRGRLDREGFEELIRRTIGPQVILEVVGDIGVWPVQVDPSQQKARDSDARAILQAELVKAQEKLKALKAEYNDGYPTKSALELRNSQVYNERLESLKASIARQESDIAGIQRELARHFGG